MTDGLFAPRGDGSAPMAGVTPQGELWASRPPLSDRGDQPWGPTPPYQEADVDSVVPQSAEDELTSRIRSRRKKIAGAGLALLAAAGGLLAACSDEKGSEGSEKREAAVVEFEEDQVCEDGLFPNGPYESQQGRLAEKDEVDTRPESRITTTEQLLEHFFGKDGVACEGAPTLASLVGPIVDLTREADTSIGFNSTDLNELLTDYTEGNDGKKQAETAAMVVATRYLNHAQLNEKPLTGAYYRISLKRTGNEEMPYEEFYTPEDVNFETGTVYLLTAGDVAGDAGTEEMNEDQVFAIDAATGQRYVRKAIGAPVAEKADEKEDDQQGGGEGSNQHGEDNVGGSSEDTDGERGANNGETNGCNGSCGTGGGGGNGGSGGSGGSGGGCGGGCGGGTGTTQPTVPHTTQPPATTQPPTTQPPATVPPTTPTTTKPKGTDSTVPGAPS